MNRFKKEIRKIGYKLENEYPFMPYQSNMPTIDSVSVDSENSIININFVTGTVSIKFDRALIARTMRL